jgi:hypothetical protein
MLGLGLSNTIKPSASSAPKADAPAVLLYDKNTDEAFGLRFFLTHGSATQEAIVSGKTETAGKIMNGTATVTITNETTSQGPHSAVFNIFNYNNGNNSYFLAPATSDITISGDDDYETINLTTGSGLPYEGHSLDSSSAFDEFDIRAVLDIPGFTTSDVFVTIPTPVQVPNA